MSIDLIDIANVGSESEKTNNYENIF